MKIRIYSFTENGKSICERLLCVYEDGKISSKENLAEDFKEADALIFVGATGIAVRLIAPLVKDKLTDPAVLVVDEKGQFVIPLLSGHVGRANELASELAQKTGAIAVITTATDINNMVAFDELGAKNGLEIVNRDNIKKVSGGLLKGRPINLALSDDIVISSEESDIDAQVLGLLFRPVVVGLGMRKDKEFEKLEPFFLSTLEENGVELSKVAAIASIDVKSNEPALLRLSEKYGIPLYFYSAKELESVEGEFDESSFVKETVGVSDVSARAAKALGKRGNFVLKKKKEDGMTISIFEKLRRITFEY